MGIWIHFTFYGGLCSYKKPTFTDYFINKNFHRLRLSCFWLKWLDDGGSGYGQAVSFGIWV